MRCAPCQGTDEPQGLAPRQADFSVWGCWVMSASWFLCSQLGRRAHSCCWLGLQG